MPEDFSARLNHSYLIGIYLAVNAIPDAYLLVDGPECIFHKAEHIYGKHDFYSTLLDCCSYHRIQFTGTNTEKITVNFEAAIKEMILKAANFKHNRVLFLSSIPFCTITGTEYERLIRETSVKVKKTILNIPGKSLQEDSFKGYEEVLDSLAGSIDISNAAPKPNNVAVVGYFMDRLEGDHQGNISEIKRVLKSLSLNPVSIWLSNEPYKQLANIKNAATVISLPYGRKAARTIAKRINARLIEVCLPFGIQYTQQFIRHIAIALNKESEAEAFIESEMEDIIPRLEWVIPHIFVNRKLIWIGDPFVLEGLLNLAEDLGVSIVKSIITAGPKHINNLTMEKLSAKTSIIFEPKQNQFIEEIEKININNINLIIGNTHGLSLIKNNLPKMEFGFPSYYYHVLHEEPYLGFRGCISFIQRMANAINRFF